MNEREYNEKIYKWTPRSIIHAHMQDKNKKNSEKKQKDQTYVRTKI